MRASSVRSRPNFSSAWYCSSGFSLVTRWLPAHLLERAEHRVVGDAEAAEEVAHAAGDLGHGEEQVLGGEVVVAEVGRSASAASSTAYASGDSCACCAVWP